ncbi:hypothetical protein VW29_08275 [Devosia limi DSM 17137]|uniref:DUF6468 domain-containing protein n=1 Tax=Devosia limi DSM 17137 TaxID=1121477 RepID=A0A0F5LRM9_9HYPH|nr:DUF6468 domain-containing protein [Devosia limi]KKB85003.1 hypothetical protein VW29_08275 [Devosia limi DSM 17137]SHF09342.1 hypothetical protein SAMN02745223_01812 [Devosia limi DSM 17137]
MFGLPLGLFVEIAVAILLALTIGYCVVLNERLKRLHADRDALRQMVTDLIGATNLANTAIKELKTTAVEADLSLTARLEEAERFGIELANHVTAGTMLMERIAKITSVARHSQAMAPAPVEEPNKVQSALQQLTDRARARGNAA